MSDEKRGTLDYRVTDVLEKERHDVYVDGELVAEGANVVEVRTNHGDTDE